MEKKYALIVASVASMIEQFNMHNICLLQEQGYEVHIATNFENGSTISDERIIQLKEELNSNNVKFFQIDFSRNVGNFISHKKAYSQLRRISELYNYSLMHCHSPIGGVLARLVFRNSSTKIIYTAHGFQFYKGGRVRDWVLFYPIEYIFSYFTDILITINNEDYALATTSMKAKKVFKVDGVGIEYSKIRASATRNKSSKIRHSLGLSEEEIILISVGELSVRKNHMIIIKALAMLDLPNLTYLIIGQGEQELVIKKYLEANNLCNKVLLLGYRKNIPQLLQESDIFCFPSKREGLGLAAIEAMAAGLPILTSNVNGINDYSISGETGYKYHFDDVEGFAEGICRLLDNETRQRIGEHNVHAAKKYDIAQVNQQMKAIYSQL